MEKEIKSQQHQEQQQRIPLQVDETHLKKHVNPMDFQTYTELILFHKDYKSRYADLQSANNLKQFREGFRKAINITVNAISSVSSSHLSEKYDKLHRLLSGQQIIIGDAPVSASSHPQGVYYCTDLLAEKFVTQGDVTISTNPKSAFCYAAVIVALWNDFPEFGKLLMAHMYRTYPCLVPFYIPRRIGQTNEEYYRSLGYKYDSNRVVEEQGKYLKRLSGLVRLHSAIFVTRPKRGHKRNPRGLDVAWKWLTSVLNLEPRLDVTATMLHVFLDTAGVYMQNTFRKQFLKIVNFLRDTYVPMLRNIDTGGPVSRLELLLQEYTLHKHFQQPSGILPNNFW